MKYCALCCTAKDEDPFLKEWLAYHTLIGFEHFIIYDDGSTVPIARLLDGWAHPAHTTIIRTPGGQRQGLTYAHCLEHFGRDFFWIAFLDLDEFIRLEPYAAGQPSVTDIRLLLTEFEPYAALGLNWRMFSSSGHETSPAGPVIGSYTRCLGDDIHIKSIVQPARVKGYAGPHSFFPCDGRHAVNAAHTPIPSGFPFTVPATDRAAVNHYFFKSRECFSRKVSRGNPCRISHSMAEFEKHLARPTQRDDRLLPFAPQVEALCRADQLIKAKGPAGVPGQEEPFDYLTHLRASLYHMEQGAPHQCLLHLCHAAMYSNLCPSPDPVFSLDVWVRRAAAANTAGQYTTALGYLRHALAHEPAYAAFAELGRALAGSGDLEGARHALQIIRTTRMRNT